VANEGEARPELVDDGREPEVPPARRPEDERVHDFLINKLGRAIFATFRLHGRGGSHDEKHLLTPGEPVDLEIEIWPTSIVVPAGCRIALSVRGRDYEWQKATGLRLSNFKNELTGCGPFLHDDPRDRPRSVLGGRTTLHTDCDGANYLLLPVIPGTSGR